MEVWKLIYNQAIVSFDGAVDLNICAVVDIVNLYDIDNSYKLEIIKTIMEVWRYFNNKIKETQKKDIPNSKKVNYKDSFKENKNRKGGVL